MYIDIIYMALYGFILGHAPFNNITVCSGERLISSPRLASGSGLRGRHESLCHQAVVWEGRPPWDI